MHRAGELTTANTKFFLIVFAPAQASAAQPYQATLACCQVIAAAIALLVAFLLSSAGAPDCNWAEASLLTTADESVILWEAGITIRHVYEDWNIHQDTGSTCVTGLCVAVASVFPGVR